MTAVKTLLLLGFALSASACKKDDASAESMKSGAASRRIEVAVTANGFEPDDIKVAKGESIMFVFERKTDATCAKQVVIHVDDKNRIEKELPLDQPVEVSVTFPNSGDVRYACGMSMVVGSIHVE